MISLRVDLFTTFRHAWALPLAVEYTPRYLLLSFGPFNVSFHVLPK